AVGRVNRDRPDLRQVFPHHVQRPAAHDLLIRGADRHAELLHVLVEGDRRLVEQPRAGTPVDVDEPANAADIRSTGPAYVDLFRRCCRRLARPFGTVLCHQSSSTHGPACHHGSISPSTSSPKGLTPGPTARACPRCTCRHLTRPGMPPADTPAISGTWAIASRRR